MKRWGSWFALCVVVLSVHLASMLPAGAADLWRDALRASGNRGLAVLAASAAGAALLSWASGRGVRAWMLLIPALPGVTAALGGGVLLHAARHEVALRASIRSDVWPFCAQGSVREFAAEHGVLRALGAFEGFALALAVAVSLAPEWWPRERPRRASVALAGVAFAVAAAALYEPARAFAQLVSAGPFPLTPVALGVLAPLLLTLALPLARPASRPVEASTPYREPPAGASAAPAVDAASVALLASLLLPRIAHGYLRGAVPIEGAWWRLSSFGRVPVFDPSGLRYREALLELAARWDRWILPLGVALAFAALVRGADRRAVRAWAAATALLFVGDAAGVAGLRALRTTLASGCRVGHRLATPGAAWIESAADPSAQSGDELRWLASGAVERVAASERVRDWRVGPLIHVDPAMSGRAWEAHLRRWRASSRGDALTVHGRCPPETDLWLVDPRHEVPLSEVPTFTVCQMIFEVASEGAVPAGERGVTVLVAGEWSARVRDPAAGRELAVDLRAWRPDAQVRVVRVLPERDAVTAGTVLRAANRLRDGRTRVLLAWTSATPTAP